MLKKNSRDHSARKNPGSAEFFTKQRKERNAARPKQTRVPSTLNGTDMRDIDDTTLTDEEVLAIVPAHWERA